MIYTLGTSNRTEGEFTKILNKYNIKTVVDVRRFPTSKFPHFIKVNLAKICEKEAITYLYLGEELGGFRKGGYQNYLSSDEFKKGIGIVKNRAEDNNLVIVCAERFPWRCHRRFITQELEKSGNEIAHILDEKRLWQPRKTEFRSGMRI